MSVNGNKGKFSDRLKNIINAKKTKSFNKEKEYDDYDSNKIYTNFLKIMASIPSLVYVSVIDQPKNKVKSEEILIDKKNNTFLNTSENNESINLADNFNNDNALTNDVSRDILVHSSNNDIEKQSLNILVKSDIVDINTVRRNNRKKINDIDLNLIKKNQEQLSVSGSINRTSFDFQNNKVESNFNDVKKYQECQKLEKSIINIIKKRLIKTVNELEILQSDLYILSEINGESKYADECKDELNKVKSILCKIDKLKEKYQFLKDNYDFEYLLEIDDNELVDKIIELKNMFGNNELRAVSADYKLLDVYKYLYLKIDDLEEKSSIFEKQKEEELALLKERDIDFDKLKKDVYNVDSVNDNYNRFIQDQNKLLKEIDENVSKINSYEQVDYHIKGFNKLFKNTFKYFGLLMLSPLKGIIPSIATETLITGNLIKNLYKELEWEETRKMVYEGMDYSNMINNAIDDLESTNRIVDMTLDDIVHLKIKYNEKFKKYQGDFVAYRDIMNKINDMENKILGNKIKIEIMRKRALEQQRLNNKKLRLVKSLNDRENQN